MFGNIWGIFALSNDSRNVKICQFERGRRNRLLDDWPFELGAGGLPWNLGKVCSGGGRDLLCENTVYPFKVGLKGDQKEMLNFGGPPMLTHARMVVPRRDFCLEVAGESPRHELRRRGAQETKLQLPPSCEGQNTHLLGVARRLLQPSKEAMINSQHKKF